MKTKLTVKLISVLVALSMVICCMSFAFVDVSAVTVNDKATGSAIAGSVVVPDLEIILIDTSLPSHNSNSSAKAVELIELPV